MWLIYFNDSTGKIRTSKQVLPGDNAQWAIDLNADDPEFIPFKVMKELEKIGRM